MSVREAGRIARGSGVFAPNEFYEALLRCRDEQPRRYAREVSPGLRVAVERYERKKLESSARRAA